MLILPRIIRNSILPLATMALNASLVGYLVEGEDLEEGLQTPPTVLSTRTEMELHPGQGPLPRAEMEDRPTRVLLLRTGMEGHPTSEGIEQGSNQEVAVLADSLILVGLVRCVS